MKLTERQKTLIRQHWPQYKLRFLEDGTVHARPHKSSEFAWGLLYTPMQTYEHLKAIEEY